MNDSALKGRDKQGGHFVGCFLDMEGALTTQVPVCSVLKPKKLELLLTYENMDGSHHPCFPGLFSFLMSLSLFKSFDFYNHTERENGIHFEVRQADSRHPARKKPKLKRF